MLIRKYLLILLIIFLNCSNGNNSLSTDLGFIGYILRISNRTVASSNAISLSNNDFYSKDSPSAVLIPSDRELGVQFGREVSSCELEFNTTKITPTVRYNTETKTTYFSPPSGSFWPLDLVNPISLKFSNCKSKTGESLELESFNIQLFIAEKVIYVEGTGSDTNIGSQISPVQTISTALSLANSSCSDRCAIAIKGGEYILSTGITIPTNVSIFGGFDPSDWKKRRADKTTLSPYDTIITDNSGTITSTGADPYSTVKYVNYSGSQSKSIIDGIIINGATTATAGSFISPIGSVGLTAGSGFIIRNIMANDRSSTATTVTSAGFSSVTNSGSILVQNSTFQTSSVVAATSTRHGYVYTSSVAGSSFTLENSIVNGGVSSNAGSGFFTSGSPAGNLLLSKNTITSPDCNSCQSVGVTMNFSIGASATISDNTIQVGNGSNGIGINHNIGSGIQIKNNSIQVAGTYTASVTGISFTGTSSNQVIEGNTITTSAAGAGGVNKGIDSTIGTGTISILNNTITTGSCSAASCARGIHKQNSVNATVTGNRITVGDCSGACDTRVLDFTGGNNLISNNILSYGVSTSSNPSTGIEINTGNPTINGNTITGGSCAGNCSGISISFGTNIVITNNTITSGTSTATATQIGLVMAASASNFTLTGNTISSGVSGGSTSNRIALDMVNWPANSTIARNTLINLGGIGDSIGIRFGAVTSSLRFCSNLILAGSTGLGTVDGIRANGVLSGGVKLIGNTIVLGSASALYGMRFVPSGSYSNMEVAYNIVHGNSTQTANTTCFAEAAAITYPSHFNNSLSNCSTYYNENGILSTFFCGGNFGSGSCASLMSNPTPTGNTISVPVFVNPASNNYKLDTVATPTDIQQGMNNDTTFNSLCGDSLDRDGLVRASNTSMGAYR
jgi:hypothetical protein